MIQHRAKSRFFRQIRSVKYRLYLSLIIINALVLVIGFTAWSTFRNSEQAMRQITEETIPITDSVSEIIVLSARLSALTPRLIFVQTKEELDKTYQELSGILAQNISLIKSLKTGEVNHKHHEFKTLVPEVERSGERMGDLLSVFKDKISVLIDLNQRQDENAKILAGAHTDFIVGTSPISDDAQFELIIGLENHNTSDEQLLRQAETLALALEIKAEGNLLAGILETALHYEELEGIAPLQERFEATFDRLSKYLENMDQTRADFVLVNRSVDILRRLGTTEPTVFDIQRERLQRKAVLQNDLETIEAVSSDINTSVNKLAAHTKRDVQQTKNETERSLTMGRYTVITVAGFSLLFTFMLSWLYIGGRIIGRIDNLRFVMLNLANKKYDITIDGTKSRDEIGQMANALSTFREKLIENDALTEELKISTEEAEEAKNKMLAILNATGDGIYALDMKGHTTLANPAAEKMLGYTLDEMLGKVQHELIHHTLADGAPYPQESCPIYKAIYEGKVSYVEEEVFWRKDHSSFPVSYHSTPIKDEHGTIKGAVVSFQDITDRQEKERALRHAKRDAEYASQAKSEFLANMSHELRTPLNSIIGLSQILAEDIGDGEEQEMITTVSKSANSLLEIVNDILDLSKIEAKQMVLENIGFDFRETVASITETLAPIASKKGIWLHYRYEKEDLPLIKGDPVRLGRILTNLLSNGVKYTIEGGVELVVDYEALEDERIMLKCSVIDTGIGIPKSKHEDIFHKFTQGDETTTRKFGGTGLGLAITKDLVEMMGGEIHVDSEHGKGSNFWFEIPFSTTDTLHDETREKGADEAQSDEIQNSQDKIEVAKANILVAEDHELNQAFVNKLLKRIGFKKYHLVNNGVKAVEAFEKGSYDLILMDCHMPEMNGYQATEKIRALEKKQGNDTRIPIIALTADAMVGTREKCVETGMDNYISKPIDADLLKKILAQWIVLPEKKTKTQEIKGAQERRVLDLSSVKEYADTEEEIKEYCTIFCTQTEDSLRKLETECTDGENAEWSGIAHKIKGGAGMFGATQLQKLAAEAQEMKSASRQERQTKLSELLTAYNKVKAVLQKDVLRNNSPDT